MKILMVLEREFPPDDRVEKEAISLKEAGHEVHIACYTFEGRASSEQYKGIYLHRIPISSFIYKSSAACLVFPFYFNFWKQFLKDLHRANQYDAIHIHDLPLSKIGYYFKQKHGLKLVCDQHEYYSNWIVHTAHYNTFVGSIVRLLSNWKNYEQKYLRRADLVITVEEPLRQCYIKEVGIDSEKIILVPNTPLSSVFNPANVDSEVIKKYKDDYLLFYAGGIDRLRGIDVIIEAMPEIVKKIPKLKFVLAGAIRKGYDPFKTARRMGVEERLEFVGWLDIGDLPSYIAASKVCFFTPPDNRDEINKTIATKIYQYAAMGKPTITSQVRMMRDFVENNQIGFAISSADEIVKHVLELAENEKLYRNIAQKAVEVSKNYVWENTIKPMLAFYEED